VATLADARKFAETYVTAPDGTPFSLVGRDWVLEEYWRPLKGWKLWPVDPRALCDDCSSRANTYVEGYHASDSTRAAKHRATGCAGLSSEPALVIAQNLMRQVGKTINTAGVLIPEIFLEQSESIALLAGAEDQCRRIYAKNYQRVVSEAPKLSRLAHCTGTRIHVPSQNSDLEVLPTALSSISDTRTKVVIDECRIVPPDIAAAILPTLFARGGWECPRGGRGGHTRTHDGVDNAPKRKVCSVCRSKLQPWYGRSLLLSSGGELKDSDADWFAQFVGLYTKEPHPNVHVHSTDENLNPKASKKAQKVYVEVFGRVDALKDHVDIEAGNQFKRRGEQFLSQADVVRCADSTLANEPTARKCFGFLDTSDVEEKTALVLLAEDEDSEAPFERVYTPWIHFWWPGKDGTRRVDEDAVFAHLAEVLPLFPGLIKLAIDTRGREWARRLLKRTKESKHGWAGKITNWDKTGDESAIGWSALEDRILGETIRYHDLPEIHDEFKGLIRKRYGKRANEIVDRDRRRAHKDITEAIACDCYQVSMHLLKKRSHFRPPRPARTGAERRRLGASIGGRVSPIDHGPHLL
jgi:hypothetical protein